MHMAFTFLRKTRPPARQTATSEWKTSAHSSSYDLATSSRDYLSRISTYLLYISYIVILTSSTSIAGQNDYFHNTKKDHELSCKKTHSACVAKNRWYRPHELGHCKISYNQCMREWDRN